MRNSQVISASAEIRQMYQTLYMQHLYAFMLASAAYRHWPIIPHKKKSKTYDSGIPRHLNVVLY